LVDKEPSEHAVRVRRERSGRKGKTVTVAGPLYLSREDVARLIKELKRACGSGGTVKAASDSDGSSVQILEIQGDHVERVVEHLKGRGFPAKRAGG
jgi:translation initiation factor 1